MDLTLRWSGAARNCTRPGGRGPDVHVPCAALVVAFTAAMWRPRDLPRADRVMPSLSGFALASLILCVGIVLAVSPSALGLSMWGHAWRRGFIASIGAGLGFFVAGLTGPGRRSSTPFRGVARRTPPGDA